MIAKKLIVFAVLLCAFSISAFSTVYYVANNGNDANTGTITQPFITIQRAQTAVNAGDTVYIRGGTYAMTEAQINTYSTVFAYVTYLTKSGTAGKRINYWAYPSEKPVFDFSAVKPAGYRVYAFEVTGSYIYLKGLEVIGVQVTITDHTQSECFENQGSFNTYEMLSMHDGMAIGFYLTKGGNNLILNCDAYNNWDNVSENKLGGNTDGFGCHPYKQGVGYINNVFKGCRSWFNSDDGYDCINAFEATTFDSCWSFYNGYSQTFASLGDGNGFKAGGYGVATNPAVPAVIPRNNVRFCLSVRNKSSGFYANHHLGGSDWYNNSAYNNAINFNMLNRSADYTTDVPGYGHNLKNNLGYGARSSEYANIDFSLSDADSNYFNLPVTVANSDFLSTDQTLLMAPRQADGSLPNNNFMKLALGSDLINKGLDVGYHFNGTAPDLGCFESTYDANLPVTMVSFTATTNNVQVILNWQVTAQYKNKGWEIERTDATNLQGWTTIGFVAGNGNLVQTANFSFIDDKVTIGTYQYRLKQIDFDDNIKYSNIQLVKITAASSVQLSVYPVPVTSQSTIKYVLPQMANVQLCLYNAIGALISNLVNTNQIAGIYQIELNENLLKTSGFYTVKLVVDNKVTSCSFIKTR